nr:hypothetical protein [Delftia acidovorans]
MQDLVELVMLDGDRVQSEQHIGNEDAGAGHGRQRRLLMGAVDEERRQQKDGADDRAYENKQSHTFPLFSAIVPKCD